MSDVGHGTGPVPRSDGERSLCESLRQMYRKQRASGVGRIRSARLAWVFVVGDMPV